MPESLKLFLPELFLSGMALFILGLDAFVSGRKKFWVLFFSFASLLGAVALLLYGPSAGRPFGMAVVDSFATFFKILAVVSTLFIFLLSEQDSFLMGKNAGSYSALIILSTVGIMLLCSAEDLLLLFIGLELISVPLFVLAGFLSPRVRTAAETGGNETRSSEGAIKFFLVGAFSSGLMVYGISLLYGLCGSTHFNVIRNWIYSSAYTPNQIFFLLGIIFILVGLGFKLSLVPFHQWTPDTYEGAPTPITAFFSISREAGVLVVMLRFFSKQFVYPMNEMVGLTQFFLVLSVLTMTVGNIAALRQNNLKRLLAYSSIAHAGTIFVGLVAGNQLGREGAMLYSVAYSLMSIGAFAVVIAVSKARGSDDITVLKGLAGENFGLSMFMVFFLLSLSGIPPFLGFWGKYYVFLAAIQSEMYGLVAIGLINSVIAVYYYFRIAHYMFFLDGPVSVPGRSLTENQVGVRIATIVTAVSVLLLGIFPQQLLTWVSSMSHLLP